MARFAREHGCRLDLAGTDERDSLGRPASVGEACAACSECFAQAHHARVLALADGGIVVRQTLEGLQLAWPCPGCKAEVVEDAASPLAVMAASREIVADPLCVRCRAPGRSGKAVPR